MNDLENRRREMFMRVQVFGTARAGDFAPTALATQLFTDLGEIIDELNDHAARQVSGIGGAQQGTSTRAVTRQALRDDLRAISRTAEAIAQDTPGFDDKFRMPPAGNDQNLLHAARSFATDAAPLSAQFISHELPANFLADLHTDIVNFESAINQQSGSVGTHISAGNAIDRAIAEGLKVVKKLDAIVRNRYTNDPAALAEWTSTRHTERSPRHQQPAPPPSPTAPTPPA